MKGLNFRNFAQPTFPITMNDAGETTFTLTAPTVDLVERLKANQDELMAVFNKNDHSSLDAVWELAAGLINCNRECRQVTVEELKGSYGMNYPMLFAFLVTYGKFIDEIESAKN